MNNKYPTTKPSLNLDFANTKSLDPRITFRRGTPGTYYDGVTHVKAEENLIDYSEDFSQWGYGRIVQTSGQSAPDGSSDAYKIEQASGETYSGYLLETYNTSANKSYTFSVYAKAGTNRNYVVLRTFLSSTRFTYFDLANGVVDNVDGRHIASISDAGNGWYRCSITYTPISTSSVQFNVYFSDNDSSLTVADDGGFIYLWGAQLEQRDSVTSYTATNGTPITKYQPKLMTAAADHARFDHDPNTGESKGLLIEESRTNLLTYSDLTSGEGVGTGWTNGGSTVFKGSNVIAPDGTVSAWNTVYNGTPGDGNLYKAAGEVTTSNSTVYTCSVWAKVPSTNTYIAGVRIRTFHDNHSANFNLLTGTVVGTQEGTTTNRIEAYPNGWYRCSITFTSGTDGDQGFQFYLINNSEEDNSAILNSSGANGEELYLWGAQLEAGSFATSYIKTTGASATRSADNASITGENFSSWYRQDEGAVFVEAVPKVKGGWWFSASDNTNANRIQINAGDTAHLSLFTNNSSQCSIDAGSVTLGNNVLIAAAYKTNDFACVIDGGSAGSDSSGIIPVVDRIYIAGGATGTTEGTTGHIKKLAYYPQRLTNEQLQNLTK